MTKSIKIKSTSMSYGDVNTPVCWYNETGADPADSSPKFLDKVTACIYPWTTPCGIISESNTGSDSSKKIMMSGEFVVDSNNVRPVLNADDNHEVMVGRRVYYETDGYTVDNWNNLDEVTHMTNARGLFPGSATVGYISAVEETNNGWEYCIKFDPRPPRANYIQVNFPLSDPSPSYIGYGVYITDSTQNNGEYTNVSKPNFTGVICTYLPRTSGSTISMDAVVLCTQGLAWVKFESEFIYTYNPSSDLIAKSVIPNLTTVNTGNCFAVLGNPGKTASYIGDVYWNKWWTGDAARNNKYSLINVNPRIFASATLAEETTENEKKEA